jgi:hypothetical protein
MLAKKQKQQIEVGGDTSDRFLEELEQIIEAQEAEGMLVRKRNEDGSPRLRDGKPIWSRRELATAVEEAAWQAEFGKGSS